MSRKIVDYSIVTSSTTAKLAHIVCEHMKDDWQPLGGVCHNTITDSYSQAMVGYEEVPNEP